MDGSAPVVLFEHNVEYQSGAPRRAGAEAVDSPAPRTGVAEAPRAGGGCLPPGGPDHRGVGGRSPAARTAGSRNQCRVDSDRRGHVLPTPQPHLQRPAHLVFSGSMDWHPNEDAVLYFMESILPAIRAQVPETTFGGRTKPDGSAARGRPSYWRRHRHGNGQRRAPLHRRRCRLRGAAAGRRRHDESSRRSRWRGRSCLRPPSAPKASASSLAPPPASATREFASAVVSLLRDPARRAAGRRRPASRRDLHYSWPTIGRVFEQRCEEVVAAHVYPAGADRRAHLSRGGAPRSRQGRVVAGEHNEIGWSAHHP